MKKLPWTSLLLLLCTYSVFGWLLTDLYSSRLIWLIGAAYISLIALALTDPQKLIRSFYANSLQSDSRAFISVIVGAFVAVIFMHWIGIFIRILVLISACSLVRLDLQTAGYSKWQSFGILVIVSLSGFCLGILVKHWDWPMEVRTLLRN